MATTGTLSEVRAAPGNAPLSLRRATLLALAGALAANAALYLVGDLLGAFPDSVLIPNRGAPLTLLPVLLATATGVLGAAAVFAALRRTVGRPGEVFRVLAGVLLVVSFVGPFTIPLVPPLMLLFLEAMHVAAAVSAVSMLARVPGRTALARR